MDLINVIVLYLALLIVVVLHELGHFPERIKFKMGILPVAAAMRSRFRAGGLIVNIILFVWVFTSKPENMLLQYIGLVSFVHFVLYAILGSILPEPRVGSVDDRFYVYDDVPNEWGVLYVLGAFLALLLYGQYYYSIFQGVLA